MHRIEEPSFGGGAVSWCSVIGKDALSPKWLDPAVFSAQNCHEPGEGRVTEEDHAERREFES